MLVVGCGPTPSPLPLSLLTKGIAAASHLLLLVFCFFALALGVFFLGGWLFSATVVGFGEFPALNFFWVNNSESDKMASAPEKVKGFVAELQQQQMRESIWVE